MERLPSLFLSRNKRAGSILVMALWIVLVIAIFAIGLARIAWSNYLFSRFKTDRFLSREALEAVILLSKQNRMRDATSGYDALSEFPTGAEYTFGDIRILYSLTDEERKININEVTSSVLKELPGMDMTKAIAVANSDFKPFRRKEGILLVDEIDKEDYDKIKDFITVYGQGRVNINTCSKEIMEFIGMEDSLVKSVMEFREESGGVFESIGSIATALREKSYISQSEELELVSLMSKNLLCVKSENYAIQAETYMGQRAVLKYSVILTRKGNKNRYRVREWVRH